MKEAGGKGKCQDAERESETRKYFKATKPKDKEGAADRNQVYT